MSVAVEANTGELVSDGVAVVVVVAFAVGSVIGVNVSIGTDTGSGDIGSEVGEQPERGGRQSKVKARKQRILQLMESSL